MNTHGNSVFESNTHQGDEGDTASESGPGQTRVPSETDRPAGAANVPIAPAHTPGPWSAEVFIYDNFPTITVRAPFYGEAVHWRKPKAGHTRAEREQQNANARLIAAAPDLLERLQALYTECRFVHQVDAEVLSNCKKVIDKATKP